MSALEAWLALASPALIFGALAGIEALAERWWHE